MSLHCAVVPARFQDALSSATDIARSESEKDGVKFYEYDIDSPVSSTHRYAAWLVV